MGVAHGTMPMLPRRTILVAAAAWAVLATAGLAKLTAYSAAAGTVAAAPHRFPSGGVIPAAAGEPTLIMLAHPHCPCSRASVAELARLLAEAERPLRAYVLFVRPEGVDEEWVESDLW